MKTLEVTSHAGISLKNILFATDFSEASKAALPYAAAIARRYDSQLHVAHIMSPASYIVPSQPGDPVTFDSIHEAALADVRQRMETLASHLKTIPHHTYVREGEVWESLSDIIQTHEIDLLVRGDARTHRSGEVGTRIQGRRDFASGYLSSSYRRSEGLGQSQVSGDRK